MHWVLPIASPLTAWYHSAQPGLHPLGTLPSDTDKHGWGSLSAVSSEGWKMPSVCPHKKCSSHPISIKHNCFGDGAIHSNQNFSLNKGYLLFLLPGSTILAIQKIALTLHTNESWETMVSLKAFFQYMLQQPLTVLLKILYKAHWSKDTYKMRSH